MFAKRYYGQRYWPARYWEVSTGVIVVPPPPPIIIVSGGGAKFRPYEPVRVIRDQLAHWRRMREQARLHERERIQRIQQDDEEIMALLMSDE